ncbi:MAG: transglycosylase SLT domain-containing protein [Actinobacteria bacterium]|nr:transglycosylase SLT domain-containing protein [Actinomycetota bacterium]
MRTRLLILLGVALVACSVAVAAGARGTRETPVAAPRLPALPTAGRLTSNRCPIPTKYRPAFTRAANDTGFQLSMLVAVAQVESNFKPGAISPKDARGLLQVLPTTGASLDLNVNNPATNVLAGARYLQVLFNRYNRTDLALAAYNAGPTRIDQDNDVLGPISMRYVANVEARWAALAGCD